MIMPSPSVQGAADLVVGSPSVSHSGPVAEASFTLSAIVSNTGDGASAATTLRYYRSTDATITTSDTAVGTQAVAGLSPSGSVSRSVGLTAPSSPGIYYYGACVDAVADESDTANNCASSAPVEVLRAKRQLAMHPDLVVGSPSVSPDTCAPGARFTVSATVSNTGDGQSPATTLRYYRSGDATITTSDTEAGTDMVGGLAPGRSSGESVELTAPSSPGAYNYGACVDAVAGESDTTNNCSVSVRTHVLDAQAIRDDGDGTRAGAANLGDITENSSSVGENGRVGDIGGPVDRVDYFRFSLSEEKRVEFALRTVHRLETRTDLFLEDATGGVLRQKTSTAVGPLWLRETLQAGTYYLRADDDSDCQSIYVFTFVVSQ